MAKVEIPIQVNIPVEEVIEYLKKDGTLVEVVRCKDCKHWELDAIFSDGWCRGKHQGNPDWFCADGESRADQECKG